MSAGWYLLKQRSPICVVSICRELFHSLNCSGIPWRGGVEFNYQNFVGGGCCRQRSAPARWWASRNVRALRSASPVPPEVPLTRRRRRSVITKVPVLGFFLMAVLPVCLVSVLSLWPWRLEQERRAKPCSPTSSSGTGSGGCGQGLSGYSAPGPWGRIKSGLLFPVVPVLALQRWEQEKLPFVHRVVVTERQANPEGLGFWGIIVIT